MDQKIIKEYIETDHIGTHKVIEYKNGVKVRLLQKPSEEYKKKSEKAKKEMDEIRQRKKAIKEKEKLIEEKMRELAIKELEKEGKI